MKASNDLFSRLKCLSEFLLLLKHFFFIPPLFFLDDVLPVFDHVIEISWFFVDSPSVLDFLGLKFEHVVLKEDIYFSIAIYFCFHFFDLDSYWAIKIIFEFTGFFDVDSLSFDFELDLLKALKLLNSGSNDPFGNGLDEPISNFAILISHVVTNLLGLNIEKTNLYPLNDFTTDFFLSFAVELNLLFDLLDIFRFVFFDLLELLVDVE